MKNDEKKTEVLKIRLTKLEYDYLKNMSEVMEKSMSEIMRRLLCGKMPTIIEGLEVGEVKRIVTQITRVGNLQKKLDDDILRAIDTWIEMTPEQLLEIKEVQDEYRKELLMEVKAVKKILVNILDEMR